MAVDTKVKRWSVLHLGRPGNGALGGGGVELEDRLMMAGLYSGYTPRAPGEPVFLNIELAATATLGLAMASTVLLGIGLGAAPTHGIGLATTPTES